MQRAAQIIDAALSLTLAVFCLFLLSQPAAAQNVKVELPFTSARSLLLVSVMVDGTPRTLIFDIGAERTLIHSTGQSVEHRATVILPGKTLSNFPLILSDLTDLQIAKAGADGVLGEDIIGKFDCVGIDYARKVITLESHGAR
ncbi:MAG: hypothetical protein LAP21_08300 [Acidobacteriia bacterium]|nr:hypothetical protein [Terriglobia bacterium]